MMTNLLSDAVIASSSAGVLLVNLGTPEAATTRAVRRYLRQFLSDRRVIDYPVWLWQPLLRAIILNVRPRKSARLYASIWTENGSPLLFYSQSVSRQLEDVLSAAAGKEAPVVLAMRYGQPSIVAGLERLQAMGIRRVLVLPLFPQYSATTTATIFDVVYDWLKQQRWPPEILTVNGYHDHPLYVTAVANSIKQAWERDGQTERLIFSFHGLPQRYVRSGDPYHEFCHTTAKLVTAEAGITADTFQVCFQSRFGPEEWLRPYTDQTLSQLPALGVKRIHIVCPGFAVDCLETLEEVATQNGQRFMAAGGQAYHYVPCLNDEEAHITLLAAVAQQAMRGWLETADFPGRYFEPG